MSPYDTPTKTTSFSNSFIIATFAKMATLVEPPRPVHTSNGLLRAIPAHELAHVLSISERVQLIPNQILHECLVPMEYVYFVESGLVSVAAKVSQERFVEVWLIGSEGLAGAPVVLGAGTEPLHRRTVQVAGQALRVRAQEFRAAMEALPAFRRVLYAYLNVVLSQTSQSGACNAAHSMRDRLARWLLFARSRLDADDIPLTHGVLAQLLGVRRASVTECLEQFEEQELISNTRGRITICNPDGLRGICCDCFRLIDREYVSSSSGAHHEWFGTLSYKT
jgi:CRP-like cAMP-binding protein